MHSFHLKAIHLCCHCPFGKLEIDWIITGHHKNGDTIRKQKYQEPGVEAELNLEFLGVLQLHLLKTIWA